MLDVLPKIYQHWVDTPHSLIARLYGVYNVKIPHYRPVILMLMANTLRFQVKQNVSRIYDLKGSHINREIKTVYKPTTVLKDTNLLKNATDR